MKPKGTLNNATIPKQGRAKAILDAFSDEEIINDLRSLKPDRRLFFIISLLEFIDPKLARKEINDTSKEFIIRRV